MGCIYPTYPEGGGDDGLRGGLRSHVTRRGRHPEYVVSHIAGLGVHNRSCQQKQKMITCNFLSPKPGYLNRHLTLHCFLAQSRIRYVCLCPTIIVKMFGEGSELGF